MRIYVRKVTVSLSGIQSSELVPLWGTVKLVTSSTSSTPLRAVTYDRESKGNLVSIGSQNSSNQRIVDDYGYNLVGMFADKVGASRQTTKIRKGYPDLLAVLAAHRADVVVTTEPSRLDRKLESWAGFVDRCRDNGVQIHLSGEDDLVDPRKPSHWKRLIDAGVAAQMETEMLSARVKRGIVTSAGNGSFHGDAPYGYLRVIVGETAVQRGRKMVKKLVWEQRPHPEHAPIVIEIIQRIARKDPIITIVADLNSRGIPSPEVRLWSRKTVRRIALNVAYIGQRRHLDTIHQGTWPPISEDETFEKTFLDTGRILADPARKKTKPGRLKWLLSYLAVGPCGESLHYMPARQGRPDRYHCVVDGCATIAAGPADEYVILNVIDRLSQPGARRLLMPPSDDEVVRKATAEAAKLREKLRAFRVSAAKPDGISPESLAELERLLAPQIEDADKRATSVNTSVALLDLLTVAEAGKQMVRPAWEKLSIPARRDVLKHVLGEIQVGRLTHRLTRVSTPEERFIAAAERITFRAPS